MVWIFDEPHGWYQGGSRQKRTFIQAQGRVACADKKRSTPSKQIREGVASAGRFEGEQCQRAVAECRHLCHMGTLNLVVRVLLREVTRSLLAGRRCLPPCPRLHAHASWKNLAIPGDRVSKAYPPVQRRGLLTKGHQVSSSIG